jgi:hypothetical protein
MKTVVNCDISREAHREQKQPYLQEESALRPPPLAVLKIVVSPVRVRVSPFPEAPAHRPVWRCDGQLARMIAAQNT